MKTVKSISLGLLLMATAVFTGCGPSAEDILKKYESHATLDAAANKAGISLNDSIIRDDFSQSSTNENTISTISIKRDAFVIEYSHPALHKNKDNVNLLNDRFVVLRADKPEETVPVNVHTKETENGLITSIDLQRQSDKGFFLIGFKGIDASESSILATPPCFFIVSCKDEKTVLTQQPQLADGLFAVDYPKTHLNSFSDPQTYSGTVNFEKSKDVTIDFTLSADSKQVTNLKFSAGELYMLPSSKNSGIASSTFSGRFENPNPQEIHNGKISRSAAPLYFDLSVTDACLYGTVQFELEDTKTKPVYTIFKNVTTPQDIPAEILNPKNE
ncbi:MAG: hypothetical protein LBU62_06070 [Bacteroidales bacterium]|jgi:hypothetical protein|nr:hypothetical protein [Bacteroidales bacterium]